MRGIGEDEVPPLHGPRTLASVYDPGAVVVHLCHAHHIHHITKCIAILRVRVFVSTVIYAYNTGIFENIFHVFLPEDLATT